MPFFPLRPCALKHTRNHRVTAYPTVREGSSTKQAVRSFQRRRAGGAHGFGASEIRRFHFESASGCWRVCPSLQKTSLRGRSGRRRRERRRCSGPGGKEKSASSKLFLPSGCQLFRVWVLGAVLHMTRLGPPVSASFHPAVQQLPPLQSSFLSQRFLRGQKPRGLTWPALHVLVSMVMMTTGPPAVNTAPSVHALIDGRGSV